MKDLDVAILLVTFFGFLVALTMHEAAHAFVGRFLGDRSTETAERATINPLPHIDLVGTIIFPVVMMATGVPLLFGWAKPTNIDSRYFKKPKRDINIVALSGPGFNFLIAVICGIAIRFLGFSDLDLFASRAPGPLILQSVASSNIVIGVFNLLPFPNSDGWRIIINTVNYNTARMLQEKSGIISIVMLLLFMLGIFMPIIRFCISLFYIFVLRV